MTVTQGQRLRPGWTYIRVVGAVALLMVGFALLFTYFISSYSVQIYALRQQELVRLAEIAEGMLDPLLERTGEGRATVASTRDFGAGMLRNMTVQYRLGENFIFMYGFDGSRLVYPPDRRLEGLNAITLQDDTGKFLVREMIEQAQKPDRSGFVEYWQDGQHRIAYVIGLPVWNALIGTSTSLAEIDASVASYTRNSMLLTGGLSLGLLLLVITALHPMMRSYQTLLRLFDQVIRDPDVTPIVPLRAFRAGSDSRKLLAGFQTMIDEINRNKALVAESYKLLESRVAERTQELKTLLDISHNVASTLELEPLIDLILQQLKDVKNYDGASVYLLEADPNEPDARNLVLLRYRGPLNPERITRVQRLDHAGPYRQKVIEERKPVIIPDIHADAPMAEAYRRRASMVLQAEMAYIRSWLGVPLIVKDAVIGLLSLDHREPQFYHEKDAGLVLAFANQAAVAIENAQLYKQAKELAALQERQRLARDLHDAVTQTLFSASLIADVLPRMWDRNPEEVKRRLEELRQLTRGALAEMRALLLELRPSALIEVGLGELLRHLAEAITSRVRLPVSLRVEGHDDAAKHRLPPDVQVALYRIAQEALNNVTKHAQADAAAIYLRYQADDCVELIISDDGTGFDPASIPPDHFGVGIMRERAVAIGGSFNLESVPGEGTTIRVNWQPQHVLAAQAAS